jgi:hypothetical protein
MVHRFENDEAVQFARANGLTLATWGDPEKKDGLEEVTAEKAAELVKAGVDVWLPKEWMGRWIEASTTLDELHYRVVALCDRYGDYICNQPWPQWGEERPQGDAIYSYDSTRVLRRMETEEARWGPAGARWIIMPRKPD